MQSCRYFVEKSRVVIQIALLRNECLAYQTQPSAIISSRWPNFRAGKPSLEHLSCRIVGIGLGGHIQIKLKLVLFGDVRAVVS